VNALGRRRLGHAPAAIVTLKSDATPCQRQKPRPSYVSKSTGALPTSLSVLRVDSGSWLLIAGRAGLSEMHAELAFGTSSAVQAGDDRGNDRHD
jgi:hypothetical protein